MKGVRARTPVVTGLGIVSPIGSDCTAYWHALMTGTSGVGLVRSFDTSRYSTHIGCEIPRGDYSDRLIVGRLPGRAALLATMAGQQALAQADLPQDVLSSVGTCIGTTMGEACWLESWPEQQVIAGDDALPAEELLRSGPDQVGLDTARLLGLGGPVTSYAAACAAGNYAIGRAADLIRLGRADWLIAGGTDAFSRVAYTGFARLGALAKEACRPFSADRDGLVLGEGAAMLVLESLESAQARAATIYAVVSGFGLSCDAFHIVSPHPEGAGVLRSMQAALKDADLSPDDIDYICAHGTGTVAGDAAEVAAVRQLYGGHRAVPMSSVKALTGHALGASSAMEAVACILALNHQIIPPTWNFGATDSACAWDVVPNKPRPAPLRMILNNANAFGGHNATVIFGHPQIMAEHT
jgi:3-oxoacyl-[acyl-carrier-protein] synthase II